MFSAILGLASAGVGLIGAGYNYSLGMEELALKRKALADQKDMAMLNYGMGRDQMRREREQEAYLRDINEQNQRLAQQEYAVRMGQFEQRKQAALEERRYVIERQVEMDREAAERQAFMLEQFLLNQNLAAEERAYAEEQLDIARATAKGERDEDLRKRAEEQEMAALEREFAIEEMRQSQMTAAQERQEDFLFRDDIIGRLDSMSAAMSGALEGMPAITAPELLGRDDFEEILARFDANAIANVDRAVDRIASKTEADLMTRGLQHSSAGTSARADIARRMALDYENARQGALQEALAYISGQNDIVLQDYNATKDARGTRMAEISAMLSPAIEGMMNMRQLSSANNYQAPVAINSGIVQRGVSSANDFQTPVGMSSAIFNNADIGFGMADMLGAPSAANAYVFDAGTATFNPQMWNITSPSGFFGNASSGINAIPGHYDPGQWMSRGDAWTKSALGDLGWVAGQPWGKMGDAGSGSTTPFSSVGFTPNTTLGSFLGYSGSVPTPTPRPANSYYHR